MDKNGIASIHITAKRWFQKSAGNTYHSAVITVLDIAGESRTLRTGIHYGYGEGWDQTALALFLAETKLDSDGWGYLTRWARENGIPCITSVADVSKERDLDK